MSSNKNETAVHGCNPAISVLVVLVSHKVYFLCSTISLAVLFVRNRLFIVSLFFNARKRGKKSKKNTKGVLKF